MAYAAGTQSTPSLSDALAGRTPMNINTSIQPSGVYTPQQTRYAANQNFAHQSALADPRFAMKQFSTPGISQGAQSYASAMPDITAAQSNGIAGNAQIPFQDASANSQQMLSGQVLREMEGLGWGNIGARQQELQTQQNQAVMNPLTAILSQYMSG